MPRKVETRAFVINCLKAIARNPKVHPALRVKVLDRISVMEKFYQVALELKQNATRDMIETKTDIDERVEQMLKQLGGDNASELP
jgi:hypothetical protein